MKKFNKHFHTDINNPLNKLSRGKMSQEVTHEHRESNFIKKQLGDVLSTECPQHFFQMKV